MNKGWSRLHLWFKNTLVKLWRSSCGRSPSVEMIKFVFHQAPTQHPIQGSADPSGFWETSRALGPAHHHGWSFIRATLPARRLRFRPTAPPPDSQITGTGHFWQLSLYSFADIPAGKFDVVVTDHTCSPLVEKNMASQEVPLVSPEWLIQSVICGECLGFHSLPRYRHDYAS